MKTIRTILLFALVLFLLVIACDNMIGTNSKQKAGSPNTEDYGEPHKIYIASVPDDQRRVIFGVIADSHIDASNAGLSKYRDTDHVKRNRTLIHDINIDAYNAGCLGIVHLGDMW